MKKLAQGENAGYQPVGEASKKSGAEEYDKEKAMIDSADLGTFNEVNAVVQKLRLARQEDCQRLYEAFFRLLPEKLASLHTPQEVLVFVKEVKESRSVTFGLQNEMKKRMFNLPPEDINEIIAALPDKKTAKDFNLKIRPPV